MQVIDVLNLVNVEVGVVMMMMKETGDVEDDAE
jgi:hypothetical protein